MRPVFLPGLLAAAGALLGPWGGASAEDQAGFRDQAIDRRTQEVETRLGTELETAPVGHFVVRGDHDVRELAQMADVAERTLQHFARVLGAEPEEVLPPPRRGGYRWVDVYQFRQEKGYLAFLDRVFDPLRDETVDDRRFKLMRRQRGFFVVTPRKMLVQYQGPGEFSTCLGSVVHKTSHLLMLTWQESGTWMPWWYLEGFAAWQELAILRRSDTYCLEVSEPGGYAKPGGTPEADEAAKARQEQAWRSKVSAMVRARDDKDFLQLGRMSLNELVLEDVIQSWSVVDWIESQKRLRSFTLAYKAEREIGLACEKGLGMDVAAAHQAWRRWVLARGGR